MRIGGGLILPSGSVGDMYSPVWVSPSKHLPFPVEIPDGTLVRVLPIAGPIWSGVICVVLRETTPMTSSPSVYPMYQVSTGAMTTFLPKYALDVIAFPPEYEPSWE